ncbi:Heterogeneous nuclear ribonucleoprotein like [Actinidia chinensis var. chinensis]|uniref:Heterogeneous nuclear ribonucleoprotein like n=1 Tax=Actinidia chinensis var. chinensis TaxID=1590841 RepID=A0A2R6PA94_ACTCC|nr:Heterogeneous nuclear ribonucleoprotein like [Actinidia chinensis var. chinensis]
MSLSSDHRTSGHQHAVRGSEVFVGGLSRSTAEDKIREVFSTCGQIVEVRLVKDQKGNSKGFCFLRFSTKEAADKAVKDKSGIMLEGKKIGVLPSTEQDSLFLGNLPKDWSADEFDKIVHEAFPDVVSVDLAMPFSSDDNPLGQKQHNRGFAIVRFSSHGAAARAFRMGSKSDFFIAGNCHPTVKWAEEEPEVTPEELAKIKVAFVRNLPADADENYVKKLFEPLGKLDRVVVSKKGHFHAGFVHFSKRSDLDKAIREMNGKTVQGPKGGPSSKIQVEVARPIEKSRKRARDDSQSKPVSNISSQSKISKNDQIQNSSSSLKYGTQELKYSLEEPVVTDQYEAAVVSLPVAIKDRLLRILRLGIATRFDIDIHCLTSLKELPESTAITILDQFMLSGAERHNKGEYLAGLIYRHQVDKLGMDQRALNLSRIEDMSTKESQLSSFSNRVHLPAADRIASRVGTTMARYDSYESRYSSLFSAPPLSGRAGFGKLEESNPSLFSASPLSTRAGFGTLEESSNPNLLRRTPFSSTSSYSNVGMDSPVMATADHQPPRPQVRFDPFTGQPYKFDPYTGEPIRPESLPRRF